MCGIIGKIGPDAGTFVVQGLKTLEYRGYDSSGIAFIDNGELRIFKGVGTIDRIVSTPPVTKAAIGHTRWATHGGVTDYNTHPHVDCSGRYAVVHNGIIENYAELRSALESRGHRFGSETDSEVIVHLFEDAVSSGLGYLDALAAVVRQLRGQYAIAILTADGHILAARNGAPLLFARDSDALYVSSDPVPLLFAPEVYRLVDGSLLHMYPGGYELRGSARRARAASARSVELGSYSHYMEKEIFEQPRAIEETLQYLARIERPSISGRVHLVAAGTSYHAALFGEYLLRRLGVAARAFIASEYSYWRGRDPDLLIAISQSGETEDLLSVLRGGVDADVLAITNTPGSTIEEYANTVIYTRAGPEVGVAATKTYTTQLTVLAWLAGAPDLSILPRAVASVLKGADRVRSIADRVARSSSAYFLGRAQHVVTAKEGALKLKEISYVHAEAYPAGESKHGPISLVEDGFPVFFAAGPSVYSETASNIEEMRARGAWTVLVSPQPLGPEHLHISVPQVPEELLPVVEIIPFQLLAYYAALHRGNNPDRPRNLAKSVTVK